MGSATMQSVGIGGGIAEQATTAAYNKNESKKGRNFNEAVMKNKTRWMVNDMKRAGINPLTAFLGGGGMSGGATLSGPTASMSSSGSTSSSALRSGAEAERAKEGAKRETAKTTTEKEMPRLISAQADASRASAARDREQGGLFIQQRHESVKREDYYKALAESERFTAKLKELDIPGARNRAAVERSMIGEPMSFADRVLKGLSPIKLGGK